MPFSARNQTERLARRRASEGHPVLLQRSTRRADKGVGGINQRENIWRRDALL
jgi:hypothetical protein